MLRRTFPFWRRLVGKTPAPSADAPTDRRVWVRYPADVLANVQPAQGQASAGQALENRVLAKVR